MLRVGLKLSKADPNSMRKEMEDILRRRSKTQPITAKSVGCIFKNPPGQSAGVLIEKAGLKGYRIGNAMISVVHSNFIVNLGGAKAKDVLALIEKIKQVIYEKFSIVLETEVKIIQTQCP